MAWGIISVSVWKWDFFCIAFLKVHLQASALPHINKSYSPADFFRSRWDDCVNQRFESVSSSYSYLLMMTRVHISPVLTPWSVTTRSPWHLSCTFLPTELDLTLLVSTQNWLIHLNTAAAKVKTCKNNICVVIMCLCCCTVSEMLFFLPRFWTHSLGLNPPDCMWPWTVCHLPAFTPSVTILFTLSLR